MFKRVSLVSAIVVTAAAILGCQTSRPPAATPVAVSQPALMQQWQGHFSIKLGPWGQQPADGQSFTFFLQADDQTGQLDLMTPLGTQLAQVRWTASASSIESADGTQRFDSLPALSQQLLGEDVPLQSLPYWLSGKPSPRQPSTTTNPASGTFEQAGWTIDASDIASGKLQASRQQTESQRLITIKVRLDR